MHLDGDCENGLESCGSIKTREFPLREICKTWAGKVPWFYIRKIEYKEAFQRSIRSFRKIPKSMEDLSSKTVMGFPLQGEKGVCVFMHWMPLEHDHHTHL